MSRQGEAERRFWARSDTHRIRGERVVVRAEIPRGLKRRVLEKLEGDLRYSSFSHLVRCLLQQFTEEER